MLLSGLVLLLVGAGLSILDFLGVTPGAAGVVSLLLASSLVLFLSGAIRASVRGHHLRHRDAHR
jgi:hypothetical protein